MQILVTLIKSQLMYSCQAGPCVKVPVPGREPEELRQKLAAKDWVLDLMDKIETDESLCLDGIHAKELSVSLPLTRQSPPPSNRFLSRSNIAGLRSLSLSEGESLPPSCPVSTDRPAEEAMGHLAKKTPGGHRPAGFFFFGLTFLLLVLYYTIAPEEPRAQSARPHPPPASPDARDLQVLLSRIAWPAPAEAADVAFASSTCPEKSGYALLPRAPRNYTVGDTLLVRLEARDHAGRRKRYGGDLVRAKVHSPELKAAAAGTVQDHGDGSYTLAFPLLWAGAVRVAVRLTHSSEAVALLRRIRRSQPSTVAFFGYFALPDQPGKEEVAECNVHPPPGPNCQYVDPGTGERWFCARPKTHPCAALVRHSSGRYKSVLAPREKAFFARAVTDQPIPGSVPVLQVLSNPQQAIVTPPPQPCRPGLAPANPAGFYYQDAWVSLLCSSRPFTTPDSALSCLKGKIVHMVGDSTLRQWWEFLVEFIPSLQPIDLHVTYQSGPLLAVEATQGLVLSWRAHGLPLRTGKTMMADLHYLANELDALGGGPDTVVAFTLWAHFTTFPLEVYVQRLRRVRQAVTQLLARSPLTTVVIKTANTGYKSVYGSDWLSQQLDHLLRAMFAGLRVAVVDAWAMTSCHYLPDNIHPGKVVVQNEVASFLSYICPQD
nr:NXPE family member 3-like [Zootoca vivipara]XP_034958053.1 NXPE family member 3-like [Zootoca vivipara]